MGEIKNQPSEAEMRETILQIFKELRDEYSDEIPPNLVNSVTNPKSKVRTGFFNNVANAIELALNFNLIKDPKAREAAEAYKNYVYSGEFHTRQGRLTTQTDIDRANNLLDLLLGRKKPEETEK